MIQNAQVSVTTAAAPADPAAPAARPTIVRFFESGTSGEILLTKFLVICIILRIICATIEIATYSSETDNILSKFIYIMNLVQFGVIFIVICEFIYARFYYWNDNNETDIFINLTVLFSFVIPIIEIVYMDSFLCKKIDEPSTIFPYAAMVDGPIITIVLVYYILTEIFLKKDINTVNVELQSVLIIPNPENLTEEKKTEILANLKSTDPEINGYPCIVCCHVNTDENQLIKTCSDDKCNEGHNLCVNCFYKIKKDTNKCPNCRRPLLERPIYRFSMNEPILSIGDDILAISTAV